MTVTDRINAENEAKYGKIKECCDMYPPFCRCSNPNVFNVKGVEAESSYAMKIENSKGYLVWGVNTLKKESKDLVAINLKPLIEQVKHTKDKYPYHLASSEGKAYSDHLADNVYQDDRMQDQGLNLSQEFLDSIAGDFRRKLNKKTFLQRLIFWK